jgi:hypothetical protein
VDVGENKEKLINDLIAYAIEANECEMVAPEHLKRAMRLCRLLEVEFVEVCEAVK